MAADFGAEAVFEERQPPAVVAFGNGFRDPHKPRARSTQDREGVSPSRESRRQPSKPSSCRRLDGDSLARDSAEERGTVPIDYIDGTAAEGLWRHPDS